MEKFSIFRCFEDPKLNLANLATFCLFVFLSYFFRLVFQGCEVPNICQSESKKVSDRT